MTFNSAQFLFFLPVFLLLYCAVFRWARVRELLLLAASYFFYMCWNWKYAGLLLTSTLFDYVIGRRIGLSDDAAVRKRLLVLSLAINLGILGVFKYFNFFMDSATTVGAALGATLPLPHHQLLLPIAISFYTFHEISYIVDIYRRRIGYEPSLVKYAVFVAFFPQLVAGPILRAAHFLPQLHHTPRISRDDVNAGLTLVFRGLFKKIVIADLLGALAVDAVFASPGRYSSWDLLLALYGYAFQIYNDFSGYSDVAIGVARMLGFRLNMNFDRPYLAESVRDFWARWHISLSTWLRDYLYIPLGGSRGSAGRTRRNLMITMLLGGLWHGAALHFVLWGAWHGLLLVLARGRPAGDDTASLATRVRRRALCFHLIALSWLLFRISGWDPLVAYVAGLLRVSGGTVLHPLYYAVLIAAATAHFVPRESLDRVIAGWTRLPAPVQACGYVALLVLFCAVTLEAPAFIYFQF